MIPVNINTINNKQLSVFCYSGVTDSSSVASQPCNMHSDCKNTDGLKLIQWPCFSCEFQGQSTAKAVSERRREGGKTREKRVVFADLILTTSPRRVFPWNRFAIALLFIQVVGELSEICEEYAFCNTSL